MLPCYQTNQKTNSNQWKFVVCCFSQIFQNMQLTNRKPETDFWTLKNMRHVVAIAKFAPLVIWNGANSEQTVLKVCHLMKWGMSGFYIGAQTTARQRAPSLITVPSYGCDSPSFLSCLFTSQIQTYSIMNLFSAPAALKSYSFGCQREMWYTVLLGPNPNRGLFNNKGHVLLKLREWVLETNSKMRLSVYYLLKSNQCEVRT